MIPGLGRHLLESTVFALAAALLAAFFMRHRGAAARHAVWLIAAAKFAVPATLFSAAGAWLAGLFPAPHLVSIGSPGLPTLLPHFESSLTNAKSIIEISTLLAWIWLAGAGVMLSLWASRLFAPAGRMSPARDSEIESLARMQERLRVRRMIHLRSSDSKMEPGLAGLWRPAITFPRGLSEGLSRAEFEAILLHELAHAKRWDNLSRGFVHALVCVFWFHPLLWWIEHRLIAEGELACDELVLRHGADPTEYVAGILKVCRFHLSGTVAGACGIAGSDLKSRMEGIMSYRWNKPASRVPRILLAALSSLMIIVPLVGGFLSTSTLNAQTPKNNKAVSKPAGPQAPVNCAYESKNFLEGTVIQYENGGQQMCVKGKDGDPLWVRTNKAIRERSSDVVILPPPPPPIICEPEPSSDKQICLCKGHGEFSEGSEVNSAIGELSCFRGEWWRPVTPAKPTQK